MTTSRLILCCLLLTAGAPLYAQDSVPPAPPAADKRQEADAKAQAAVDRDFQYAMHTKKIDVMRRMLIEPEGGVKPGKGKCTAAICAAAKAGELELARLLLENGADIRRHYNGHWEENALEAACCQKGNAEMVRMFLGAGSNVNQYISTPPLMYAVQTGDLEMVKVLVEAGAETRHIIGTLSYMFYDHPTAAVYSGNVELLQYLLDHGAVFMPGAYGDRLVPPAVEAAKSGNTAMVKRVLELGQDVNALGPMQYFFNYDYHTENATPLMVAAYRGDVGMVQFLLEHGAGPALRNRSGRTALMAAALPPISSNGFITGPQKHPGDRAGVIRLLVQKGLDVNDTNIQGKTALFTATEMDSPVALIELIAQGADVNKASMEGTTPLMSAARWGNEQAVRLLLQAGADAHAKDLRGRNAMWHAAAGGNTTVLKMLMDAGVPTGTPDFMGVTPLMTAASHKQAAVLSQLIAAGEDINATDSLGYTVLHHACKNHCVSFIHTLLEAGADAKAKDRLGRTPDEYLSPHYKERKLLIEAQQK